jgi:glycerate kinase
MSRSITPDARPRVIVAPDKFKGSCTARQAGDAIVAGLRAAWGDAVTYRVLPLADGGDGTVAAFLESGATAVTALVRNPLGEPVTVTYARSGATAIIEMAAASGLVLVADRRDARHASSFGTGQLVSHALRNGARHIVLAIGGSATTDGGAGALAALGIRFLDAAGSELAPNPAALAALATIDAGRLDARVHSATIEIACDVDNPLLGPNGAAAVYGPQKGASNDDVAFLERVLTRIADAAAATTGRDLRTLPGAGAAGGIGWACATFLNARLERGFDIVAKLQGFAAALAGATLCVTGEGRIDAQSLAGKVIDGVARTAAAARVPVLAIGGSVDPEAATAFAARGVTCEALIDDEVATAAERDRAMREGPAFIRASAERWARRHPRA